jgi:hypothetical protein
MLPGKALAWTTAGCLLILLGRLSASPETVVKMQICQATRSWIMST